MVRYILILNEELRDLVKAGQAGPELKDAHSPRYGQRSVGLEKGEFWHQGKAQAQQRAWQAEAQQAQQPTFCFVLFWLIQFFASSVVNVANKGEPIITTVHKKAGSNLLLNRLPLVLVLCRDTEATLQT